VLTKLPSDTPTQDIFDDLKDLGFPALNVSQMRGRDKTTKELISYPLFLVSLPKGPDNKNIYDLNYLLSYRVQVETYKPPDILQCFQCQRLGHSKQTCFNDPRCVKCGKGHLAIDCPKKTSGSSVLR